MLKTVSSVANALGALNYKGTWNATTNTPTLASGVGTQGDYYVVSVAGATDLDGITNWGVGDWAAFNGSVWQRVEGGADGNFVNLDVTGTSHLEGNVGVGTGSPDNPLMIESTTDAMLRFTRTGVRSWREYIGSTGNLIIKDLSGTPADRLSIDTTGNVNVLTGNLAFASGKGIDFSATAGTGTSELLDDYEEGTWTPTITSSAGTITSSIVYSAQYTKIGRAVTLNLQFAIIDNGTGSGSISVTGAPYTAYIATAGTLYNSSTGLMGVASITSTTMSLRTATNTYPVATGQTTQLSITYIV